jgi:uncharacterized protein (TIGR00255 family)
MRGGGALARSMTGYGRAQQVLNGRDITVEVKSVNSRYFEYSSRLPRNHGFVDDALKKAVNGAVSRGKVEAYVSMQNLEEGDVQVQANVAVAKSYLAALGEVSGELGVENDVTASVLARFSDVFTVTRSETDEEQMRADILAVAAGALERYNQMRAAEGEKLAADILGRLCAIEAMLAEVEKDSAGRTRRYTRRLYERLQEVLQGATIDEGRILTEAAVFADKTAVDEETVRLRSHLKQYRDILAQSGQVGRKLDFLTQELNREVNTIGSKCQEVDITRLVVDMKAETEKIREQIQNLE